MGWEPILKGNKWVMRRLSNRGKWIYRKLDITKLGRSTLNPKNRRKK